jgi:hypothetical protein
MARKPRADIRIGNLEKKLGLASGAIRNPDGTDARADKKLGTLRREYEQQLGRGVPVRRSSTVVTKALALPKPSAPKAQVGTKPKAVTKPKPASTAPPKSRTTSKPTKSKGKS